MVFECLFEFLLTCWIDSLSDDHRFPAKFHSPPIGGYDCAVFKFFPRTVCNVFLIFRCFHHSTDMCRSCTTTAADQTGTTFQDFGHESPKFFRFYVVIHLSVFLLWKPGIRLYNDGNGGILHNFIQDRHHLLRSHAAVDSKCIYAEPFQHCYNRWYISSGQKFSFVIKDHSCKYRK